MTILFQLGKQGVLLRKFTKFFNDYCDGTPMEFLYSIYEHGYSVYYS